MFKPKYEVRKELMGGEPYFMIYRKVFLFGWLFYERCNTAELAEIRLAELRG